MGALKLLSDLESLKSVRDPLLKARFCEASLCPSFLKRFFNFLIIFCRCFSPQKKGPCYISEASERTNFSAIPLCPALRFISFV